MVNKLILKLKQPKFWRSLFFQTALLLLFLFAINWYQNRDIVNQEAPILTQTTIGKSEFDLQNQLKKGPVILYFWGDWCPICRVTSPAINALASEHQVMTVALSSGTEAQVSDYLIKEDYHFATINDPNGVISRRWGVSVTPTIIIINSDNSISSVITGITSKWSILLRLWFSH